MTAMGTGCKMHNSGVLQERRNPRSSTDGNVQRRDCVRTHAPVMLRV